MALRARSPARASTLLAATLVLLLLVVGASQARSNSARGEPFAQRMPLHQFDPAPNPDAVVLASHKRARFTVLTPQLIRLEYSQSGRFVDDATWAFITRNLPAPTFSVSRSGDWLAIRTDFLLLQFNERSQHSFNEENLQIELLGDDGDSAKGKDQRFAPVKATWKPKFRKDNEGNLLGTIRTLDGADGEDNPGEDRAFRLDCYDQHHAHQHCTFGLVSRSGFAVHDDTHSPRFDLSPAQEPSNTSLSRGDTSDEANWPWMQIKRYIEAPRDQCDAVPAPLRRDCGWQGISPDECRLKGCCAQFDASEKDVPLCFYSSQADQDLYFFGHGHDYKAALADFAKVSGRQPMPPRYSFGSWFSRYWAYTDFEQHEITNEYAERSLPLDVMITDMDWHLTYYKALEDGEHDPAGLPKGWTGYTWDKKLFPDPDGFLRFFEKRGIANSLNLHPASGMQRWEEKFDEFAVALGLDPADPELVYIPFNVTSQKWVSTWWKVVLEPLHKQGIDFWWLDWQQGEWDERRWTEGVPKSNPTFWLNYIFMTSPWQWRDDARPLNFHRWGGLGNQRYPVGFSGDTYPTWASLEFQIRFTSTASNVAYGLWSHDIGGHNDAVDGELYTRWVQWGIYSPMFRVHTTKKGISDRRIWVYENQYYTIMRLAMLRRVAMVPYIYSSTLALSAQGQSLVMPLYYDWPEHEQAYEASTGQFMFGESYMVAPVTAPSDTGLAAQDVWVPPGSWVDTTSGRVIVGPTRYKATYALSETPVFAKSGDLVPLVMSVDGQHDMGQGGAQLLPSRVALETHVGALGVGERRATFLLEDDGKTQSYARGEQLATTKMDLSRQDARTFTINVQPVELKGSQKLFPGLPSSRAWSFELKGVWPAEKVTLGGKAIAYKPLDMAFELDGEPCWTYRGDDLTLIVTIMTPIPIDQEVPAVVVTLIADLEASEGVLQSGIARQFSRSRFVKQQLDNLWRTEHQVFMDDYPELLDAHSTPSRLTAFANQPELVLDDVSRFADRIAKGREEVAALRIPDDVRAALLEQLDSA